MPGDTDPNTVSLKIDEDLYWVNDSEALEEIENFMGSNVNDDIFEEGLLSAKSYKIAAGEIPYNSSLGLYGGYKIKLIIQ